VVVAQKSVPEGRAYLEGAVVLSTAKAEDRLMVAFGNQPIQESNREWSIGGGFFPWRRVGAGVELTFPGDVSGFRGRAVSSVSEAEHERGMFITAIGRLQCSERHCIDVVGGPGFVRRRDTQAVSAFQPPNPPAESTTIANDTVAGAVVGVDVPIVIWRHLSVSPRARLYWIDRGAPATDASAMQLSVGVGGRLIF
jgi:hypothetical protein